MKLLYFKGDKCSVCVSLLPKIQEMIKRYPQIELEVVDIFENSQLAAQHSVFTVPVVIFSIEGKDYIREAGVFSATLLENKIKRLYEKATQ